MQSAVSSTRGRNVALGSIGVGLIAVVAASCGDVLASDGTREASMSFGVAEPGAAITASAGPSFLVINGGGHSVDLQSADVVFSEVTFEGQNVDTGDDDDSDLDSDSDRAGNAKFRAGATTVTLPLEGGVITPFTGTIPVGTYRSVEMDADFIRLRGTYDGQTFDVTVPVSAELELAFDPPLNLAASSDPLNISVNVDVASWLRDANGNVIDPRQLATDATLRAEFRQRVRASFRAFEDEDRDADESDSDSDSDSR